MESLAAAAAGATAPLFNAVRSTFDATLSTSRNGRFRGDMRSPNFGVILSLKPDDAVRSLDRIAPVATDWYIVLLVLMNAIVVSIKADRIR